MENLNFTKSDGLTALTIYHHNGGNLFDGLPILLEQNRRTNLKPAVLKSWHIGEVKMDLTGYGRYSESNITAEIDGKEETWPFSMIYLNS